MKKSIHTQMPIDAKIDTILTIFHEHQTMPEDRLFILAPFASIAELRAGYRLIPLNIDSMCQMIFKNDHKAIMNEINDPHTKLVVIGSPGMCTLILPQELNDHTTYLTSHGYYYLNDERLRIYPDVKIYARK